MSENIEHEGFIKEIEGAVLKVSITSKAACASCKAKGACTVSETEEKIIDVIKNDSDNYKIGEAVKVYYRQSLGFRALLLGYLIPFFIVVFCLIVILSITDNEVLSGTVSLSLLIPYYLFLYLSREKHNNTFSFSIKKIFSDSNNNKV